MGLPLRITYKDNDYTYRIVNTMPINKETSFLEILLNEEKISLVKDSNDVWIQKDGIVTIEPELAQALGRSVSLRFRM